MAWRGIPSGNHCPWAMGAECPPEGRGLVQCSRHVTAYCGLLKIRKMRPRALLGLSTTVPSSFAAFPVSRNYVKTRLTGQTHPPAQVVKIKGCKRYCRRRATDSWPCAARPPCPPLSGLSGVKTEGARGYCPSPFRGRACGATLILLVETVRK